MSELSPPTSGSDSGIIKPGTELTTEPVWFQDVLRALIWAFFLTLCASITFIFVLPNPTAGQTNGETAVIALCTSILGALLGMVVGKASLSAFSSRRNHLRFNVRLTQPPKRGPHPIPVPGEEP